MSYLVRASKYRHVFGEAKKPDQGFIGVNSNSGQPESMNLSGNTKFCGVSWAGGGGKLAILSLDKPGRLTAAVPAFKGHTGTILDWDFCPFDEHQVASSSEDCTVKVWQIPEGGLTEDTSDALVTLSGHQKKVHVVNYHKVAENLVTSASYDQTIKVWDITKGEAACSLDNIGDVVWSVSWNRQGSQFATTHKDKNARIVDPRAGSAVSEWQPHLGAKPCKAVWLGKQDRIATIGFSRQSDRQVTLWDPRDVTKPLHSIDIDVGAGVLMPMYDEDTGVMFLAGKGDTSIKMFEFAADEDPGMFFLNSIPCNKPQKGACMLPKLGGDIMKCEVARVLRLAGSDIEVVSMRVPRKATEFQSDIFPDTAAPVAALTSDKWIAGENADPVMMSAKPGEGVGAAPKKAMKTAFQLQKELDEKDKRIAELEAKLAALGQ